MMKNPFNLEEYLKNMKPEKLSENEKTSLWSQIGNKLGSQARPNISVFSPLYILKSRAFVAIALVVILLGGSAATVAADEAKPGDFLFPLDLAAEKVRLALSANDKKDELRVKFSQERLDEARIVVALATSVNTQNEGADSSIRVVVKTDGATTTGGIIDFKKIEKAENALEIALNHLEETRNRLEDKGNKSAIAVLDRIISELGEVAENHIISIAKIKTRITDEDGGIEIINFNNNGFLWISPPKKIDLNLKSSGSSSVSVDDFSDEDFEEIEGRIKERLDKSKEHLEERQEKINERLEEMERRLEDRFDGLRLRFSPGSKKIVVCHISSENPTEVITIKISTDAVREHLSHGDTLGRCQIEHEDEDEHEGDNNDYNIIPVVPGIEKCEGLCLVN